MKIIAAQINPTVGDIDGNLQLISDTIQRSGNADLIVFPELCLTGYPPEDLLLRPHLYERCQQAVERIQSTSQSHQIAIIIGLPTYEGDQRFNTALCIHRGEIIARYHKAELPNYTVFDEKRYFTPGVEPCVFQLNDHQIGLLICEDLWRTSPIERAKAAGAELIIAINASPFRQNKAQERIGIARQRATAMQLPILYVNCVGGQDELVFDGGSFAMNTDGALAACATYFDIDNLNVTLNPSHFVSQPIPAMTSSFAQIYNALVLGVRDYIQKNHFPGAIIGLSGGIDSALTLAIAADAIGGNNIRTVSMPSLYTADMSNVDAQQQAQTIGAQYDVIPINTLYNAFEQSLAPHFADQTVDTTEQNIQARIRGVLLMALSNKYGQLVLTTGNRSELSVGYTTLYGDMAGGFAVLKDIPKTLVYKLAHYRNSLSPVIPQRVLTRPPSAELAPDQIDQDTLPSYDALDEIIYRYIDQEQEAPTIIEAGFDTDTVHRVIQLIKRNEYKRRQAPPGIRISERAFGKDRRYPITSAF